jgi:hypothetical protein
VSFDQQRIFVKKSYFFPWDLQHIGNAFSKCTPLPNFHLGYNLLYDLACYFRNFPIFVEKSTIIHHCLVMKSKWLLLVSIGLSLLITCTNKTFTPNTADYLIFGHFYGLCQGETCIEIFRLEKSQLSEDTKDKYPSSTNFYEGLYVVLSNEKFLAIVDLFDFFPADLLSESNTVLGTPDAADGGGLYIEYSKNGVRKFWLIDQIKNNVPTKYYNFINKVNEKIRLLK